MTAVATLALDGRVVAQAARPDDEGQRLRVPLITTELLSEDGSHETYAKGDAHLTDTIAYENLTPGVEYEIEGELVDASTGKPAIRAARHDDTDGSVGDNATAGDSGKEEGDSFEGKAAATVVWVSDDSTYHLDESCAEATDGLRRTTLGIAKTAGKVPCEAESGNERAVAKGDPTAKTSSKSPSSTEGKKATDEEAYVSAKATFTPEATGGKATVEFDFDASGLEGKSLVAMETISRDDHIVATHRDAGDEEQTVSVPDGSITSGGGGAESMGQTGAGMVAIVAVAVGILFLVVDAALIAIQRYGADETGGEEDLGSQ